MKKVLIDNGHGVATAGKRSPDGRLREGVYAREIARRVAEELEERAIPYALITPEKEDTPLATRVYRANTLHKQAQRPRGEARGTTAMGEARGTTAETGTILVSLHSDACAGEGWHNARGMSVRVALNASQNSKTLARCLYAAFDDAGIKTRKYNGDAMPYWPQSLAICRDTKMPAVLVEMFFHDNKDDVEWALSADGKSAIVNAIVKGITDFIG